MIFKNIIIVVIVTVFSLSLLASNRYVIKLKDSSNAKLFMSSNKTIFKSLGDMKMMNLQFGEYIEFTSIKSLNSNSESDKELIKKISNLEEVEYIEKSVPVHILGRIDDQFYGKQWGLKNTGSNTGSWLPWAGKAGMDINAEKAWTITKGSRDVIVAVIDTGVDYNHKDLNSNMWINELEKNGAKGVDDDGNGYIDDIYGYDFANKDGNPYDDHSHGTHCAGVIGASHDRIGVRGVMSDVQIMALKFLTKEGGGESIDSIYAINYAITNGAHVLSNSWGGGERSIALEDAIKAANDANITFVVAAGNSSRDNDYYDTWPANYDIPNVISVASMAGSGNKSYFSNYGATTVHLFAPGSNIYSTVRDNQYKSMSGTSMAAPFVSGIAGLLKSVDPSITPEEMRARMIESSVYNSSLRGSIAKGRVDAYRTLRK